MFAGLLKFAKFFTGKIIRSKVNTNSNQASGKTKGTKNDGKTNSDQGTKEADGTNQGSKTSSTNGRYTKEFIKDLEDIEKIVTKRRFNINQLTQNDINKIAKLLGISPAKVKNMDLKTYQDLSKKFHPDKNPDDDIAPKLFNIVQHLKKAQKTAKK